MAAALTATLTSTRGRRNLALPGDVVSFSFASPPQAASDVEVEIQQAQFKGSDGLLIPGLVLAGFKGSIQNGKYVPKSAQIFGQPKNKDMPLKLSDGANTVAVSLVDAGAAALGNELQVVVRGRVAGASEFFIGRAALFVEYPLAMVVPTQTARFDPALNVISNWAAQQWLPHDREVRHVQKVGTVTPPAGALRPGQYDTLVSAIKAAALGAPGGIIALTIGHGDGGQNDPSGQNVPWCDLMPEDIREVETAAGTVIPHTLYIDRVMLVDGSSPGRFPQGNTAVRLNALDRIADALAAAALPIRKLILHTCNAGNSGDFLQRFADRIRVPVQAHTAFIAYTGFLGRGHIQAHYDGEAPTQVGEVHWPLAHASAEARPGLAPPRFPPK